MRSDPRASSDELHGIVRALPTECGTLVRFGERQEIDGVNPGQHYSIEDDWTSLNRCRSATEKIEPSSGLESPSVESGGESGHTLAYRSIQTRRLQKTGSEL